jgi:mevalonate kinase
MQTYFAPGKILLAGEYAVLLGLNAHAVPVKKGQWLEYFEFKTPENQQDTLYYKAIDIQGTAWMNAQCLLTTRTWVGGETPDVLQQVFDAIPETFWKPGFSYRLETRLEFSRDSGLGSSSTFTALMSHCFQLEPQRLQERLFQGSGYDVAIATVQKPLTFWRNDQGAHFKSWKLPPENTQDWTILFLGNKVNSRSSSANIIESLRQIIAEPFYLLQFEKVLHIIETAESANALEAALEMYQLLLSQLLNMETPYQHFQLKPVKKGLCKWLGAWGGDMLLVNRTFMDAHADWASQYPSEHWNDFVIYE